MTIVHNPSAQQNGPSLNECLQWTNIWPKYFWYHSSLQCCKIALVGDIEKAFWWCQCVNEDRDVLRFLWEDNIEKDFPEVLVLRFTGVVFGMSTSPFLLNGMLDHHNRKYDPEFVARFPCAIYVNNVTCWGNDIEDVFQLYFKTSRRLLEGGFNIRKFVSNDSQLQTRIQEEERYLKSPTFNGEQRITGGCHLCKLFAWLQFGWSELWAEDS